MRNWLTLFAALLVGFSAVRPTPAQSYAVGADVSSLGKCEQDGAVFKENGQPKDVLAILREHHYNRVRR